jgi:EmrB/QacA subfamily drug resistance transporter
MTAPASTDIVDSQSPPHAGLTLVALILVATVANLNLSVANVALPDIGLAFKASQSALNLVAVGFSLGLAGTVLYLGALGDRYGRYMMLLVGTALAVPTSIAAAWSGDITMLIVSRVLGGVAAGMAFPTTLALITALWSGAARVRAIAAWSAVGAAMAAVGPLLAGACLNSFWWGSCFLISIPLAIVAFVLSMRFVPRHVNESIEPVDHLGGVISIIAVMSLVLAINLAPSPGEGKVALIAAIIAAVAMAAFFLRQRAAREPLFDLDIARRRIFWVAATGGLIVFGTLMAAIFLGEQYLQDVLGYSTLKAGAASLPAAATMLIAAPISARLIERVGSRLTLLCGYAFCLAAFLFMLFTWTETSSYLVVAIAFCLAGIGVGLAGTPASHSLTSSVPVRRAGMASGTSDLQRDLGGSIMQSLLGAILTAGYAAAVASALAKSPTKVSDAVTSELQRSFASAATVAESYPKYSEAIIAGARSSFLQGANWAYASGCISIVVGAIVIAVFFPGKQDEERLLGAYETEDAAFA